MPLRIYSNPIAVASQNNLTKVNMGLDKSLERLSSGIRLNSAADDASGMAVSQKLETQIRGLGRAMLNIQDGISMLDTAETGIAAMTDAVGRLRELAVQSGNGIYTTSDRVELQKEVDQLKDEVDRIANSTEFNTKKLLNGDGTATWSANSDDIEVFVNSPVNEGDYRLLIDIESGINNVYSSHIMTIREGEYSAEIEDIDGNTTNLKMVGTDKAIIGNLNYETGTQYYTVSVDGAVAVTANTNLLGLSHPPGNSSWRVTTTTLSTGATHAVLNSGYLEFRALESEGVITLISVLSSTTDIKARFYNAKTGELSGWLDVSYNSASSTGISLSISNSVIGVSASFIISAGPNFSFSEGAAIGFSLRGSSAITENTHTTGGGIITIDGGVTGHSIQQALAISYGAAELTKIDNGDGELDYNRVTAYIGHFNSNTGVMEFGGIDLYFEEQPATTSNIYATTIRGSLDVKVLGEGEVASRTTKMDELRNFINADGRELFNKDQEMRLYASDGKFDTIIFEGKDLLVDASRKIRKAIFHLGYGADFGSIRGGASASALNTLNQNLSHYVGVGTEQYGTTRDRDGSIVFQAAAVGDRSVFELVGDEGVVNGFGFATSIEGRNNRVQGETYNSRTGVRVNADRFENNKFSRALRGVDLYLDSTAGISYEWNNQANRIDFITEGSKAIYNIHLVDNRTQLQIGSNEAQEMLIAIPEFTLSSLELENFFVYSQEQATKGISKTDAAIVKLVSNRANIGAYRSRLEYSYTYTSAARHNMISSNARIKDADIAQETSELTRNQVLSQTSIAMLAQANQRPQSALALLQ